MSAAKPLPGRIAPWWVGSSRYGVLEIPAGFVGWLKARTRCRTVKAVFGSAIRKLPAYLARHGEGHAYVAIGEWLTDHDLQAQRLSTAEWRSIKQVASEWLVPKRRKRRPPLVPPEW